MQHVLLLSVEKSKIKKKGPGITHFYKNKLCLQHTYLRR